MCECDQELFELNRKTMFGKKLVLKYTFIVYLEIQNYCGCIIVSCHSAFTGVLMRSYKHNINAKGVSILYKCGHNRTCRASRRFQLLVSLAIVSYDIVRL